jgi:hypothetical protein
MLSWKKGGRMQTSEKPAPHAAVPSHPLDKCWFAHVDGETFGPFSGHDVKRMIEKEQVVDSDFLCPEGGNAWVQAKNEPLLGALFRSPPRPEPAPEMIPPTLPSRLLPAVDRIRDVAPGRRQCTPQSGARRGTRALSLLIFLNLVAWVVLTAISSRSRPTGVVAVADKSIERAAPVEKPKSKPLRERGAHIQIDADADGMSLQDRAGVGEEITGKLIDAAVTLVRQHGNRCDSVTGMLPFVFSVGFTLICNDHRYKYELADKGGNWVVTVVR